MSAWGSVLVGVAVVIGPVITAIVLLRKQPAESRKLTVETVDVNVKIASDLRDDAVADRKQAREDLAALRAEFDQYRIDTDARLIEMATELRAERARSTHLEREIDQKDADIAHRDAVIDGLRGRVDTLEDEVRTLKAKGRGA